MPTLLERHDDVRRYRNDVMHAHRMSASDYDDAKGLLERVNDELRRTVSDLVDSHEPGECASLADSLVEAVERYKRFSDEIAGIDLGALAERLCTLQNVIAMLTAASTLGCSNGTQPARSDDEKQTGAKGMQGEL